MLSNGGAMASAEATGVRGNTTRISGLGQKLDCLVQRRRAAGRNTSDHGGGARLQCRSGRGTRPTGLDERLADYLLRLGPQQGRDRNTLQREPGLTLLTKIGGPAYARVVNAYLATEDELGSLHAVHAVRYGNNADTVAELLRIVHSVPNDAPSVIRGVAGQDAADVLASLGHTRVLVEALIALGPSNNPRCSGSVRAARPFNDDAVRPALDVLADTEASDAARCGAVIALAAAGRADLWESVLAATDAAPAGSSTSVSGCLALGTMRVGDQPVVSALRRRLGEPAARWAAGNALLRIRTDAALNALFEDLSRQYDDRFACALAGHEHTRDSAIALIAAHVAAADLSRPADVLATPAATLAPEALARILVGDALRDAVREEALAEEGRGWVVGSKLVAVRALAAFEPSTAFLAAEKALTDARTHERTAYPYAMAEIDQQRAVSVLLRHAPREASTPVLHAIARVLADREAAEPVYAILSASDVDQRRAGCVLSGFFVPDDALRAGVEHCLHDDNAEVVTAAVAAVRRWERASTTHELAAALPSAPPTGQWVLLDALLHTADLGDAFAGVPAFMDGLTADLSRYARDELKRRRERRDKKLQDRDRDRATS